MLIRIAIQTQEFLAEFWLFDC